MHLFSKANKMGYGYGSPRNTCFAMISINNNQGVLTDISAKTEALEVVLHFYTYV